MRFSLKLWLLRLAHLALVLASVLSISMSAQAQVVQLPSFSSFSVDTTVVVPDRGTQSLGGNARAASGSNAFGRFPPQRAVGRELSASGASAHVQIHDPLTADEGLQREAASQTPAAATGPRSAREMPPATAAFQSVEAWKNQRAQQVTLQQAEARNLLQQAHAARTAQKRATAEVLYRRAARLAQGTLQQQIQDELRQFTAQQPPHASKRAHASAR